MKRKYRLIFEGTIIVLLIVQLYPLLWLIFSSFRDNIDLSGQPFGWPSSLTLQNYTSVFYKSNILLYMRNSAYVAVLSLISIVILSSTAAFAISKFKIRSGKAIFKYFLIGLTIPYPVILIPLFVMYTKTALLDTHLGLMLPLIAFSLPVSVLLFVNFYKFIPEEIIEASIVDGCSASKIYTYIVFPLSMNTIITVVAMNFIFVWNDYVFSVIFINSTSLKTISLGLQDFIGSHGLTDWGATFASICLSTLPTLLIYFLLNTKIVGGMTMGAVKS
jgi:raffinose/stachyose/melibiose transport system permease protein